MHWQFFRIISRSLGYVERFRKFGNNPFPFACGKWFNSGNCQIEKMCRSSMIDCKLNCSGSEISRSCNKGLKRITQIKLRSTEINKLKSQPPNSNGYMITHYVGEEIVEEEERSDTS